MIGIGSDLVDVERFRMAMTRTPGLVTRVFTSDEIEYARLKNDPTERFAVRWAAKEAVMKALGAGLGEVGLREIEIIRAQSGAPGLLLAGLASERAGVLGVVEWKLSLTHTHLTAHAVAVAL